MNANYLVRPSGRQAKPSPKPRAVLLQPSLKQPRRLLQLRQRRLPIKHLLKIQQLLWCKTFQDCPSGCEPGLYSDSLICGGGQSDL
jgi:hypothetical protein